MLSRMFNYNMRLIGLGDCTKGEFLKALRTSVCPDGAAPEDKWTSFVKGYPPNMPFAVANYIRLWFTPCLMEDNVEREAVPSGLFSCDYIRMAYTCADFLSIVDEILDSVPSRPPNLPTPSEKWAAQVIKYDSPISYIFQSSGAGKTRFVLDCPKYNQEMHCFTVMINCSPRPNIAKIPSNNSIFLTICNFLFFNKKSPSITASFIFLLWFQIRKEIMCEDGHSLKDRYKDCHGILLDSLFVDSKDVIEDCMSSKELDIAMEASKMGEMKHIGRGLIIVFAFDEATYLLRNPGNVGQPLSETLYDDEYQDKSSCLKVLRKTWKHLKDQSIIIPTSLVSTDSTVGNFRMQPSGNPELFRPYTSDPYWFDLQTHHRYLLI